MFRYLLISQLILTTVLGPALCCCTARRLFGIDKESACCEAETAPSQNKAASKNHHTHRHVHSQHLHVHSSDRHAGALRKVSTSPNATPIRRGHDKKECPCKAHRSRLLAVVAKNLQFTTVDDISFIAMELSPSGPLQLEFDARRATLDALCRPANLFGREILRAYQCIRC